ncbi:Uma2 family endonuclease [Microcystis aeruginosa CS-564/01]|uniref:Uma2 family endonuclease n=1 Tax=Microcystis aeruginosa TaxID=1126 RepID=UPI00232D5BE4|nr:Uma2 family endonuclease [Microcystis aeruginosa]MDB9425350.1 Uma2 family endonuclease [Microcystis aeruginosa CS-564/01]
MTDGKTHAYFTPKDYLEIEKISPIKPEYIQGQILAMAGASKAHVIITSNLSAQLINRNLSGGNRSAVLAKKRKSSHHQGDS